jgi:outer membrane protein TolC
VSSSLIKENIILQQLKLDLLTKMNEVSLKDFTVQDSLLFESSAELEKNYSSENNTDILSLKKNQEILNSIRKESQSFYFPRLNFNSSYVFSRNENAAGFALLNQNLGLNNGLSLTWNFFDGGKNRVATKNAQIDLYIAKMRVEQLQRKVDAELNFYRNALQEKKIQIDLERQNQVLAEELLKIILERYEQGLCTIVEVNISRQDLLSANLRQIEELYNFKLLELESKRRTGKLIR